MHPASEAKRLAGELISQKTALATLASGTATMTAGLVHSINQYIPLIGLFVTITFAIINVVINYKRYKLEKESKNDESEG